MQELFVIMGTMAIDTTETLRAIDEVSRRAREAERQTGGAFDGIMSAAGTLGTAVAAGVAVVGGAFIAAVEGSRDYRAEMGLLQSAFATAELSSEAAKNTYSDLNAVMRDSGAAVEASQHLALIADNENELQAATHTLTGIYATFGQSLPLEGLSEAINHSSSLGEVQGSLADALEWSGITVDDFNVQLAACSDEEERQDLIMRTLSDTYDKAADQYKETNKDVMEAEKANEALADAFAEIGAVGEPILTAIKEKVAEMVTAAVPHLENFIQKVKDLKQWIQDNQSTIDAWVAVIIGATVSIGAFLLILNWGSIMGAATKAIQGVRGAILLFNAALRANPIGLIISLLAGLVAAFIYLWNNNEGFRKFWIDLWEKIKSAGGKAIDWIKNKFEDFKGALKTVREVFSSIQSTISEKVEAARKAVKDAIDKIKKFFDITLKFKGISMPDISIAWKKKPKWMYEAAQLIGLDGVPSFSVKWNAQGGILDKPTIFGITQNGQMLGAGESGPEAIAPITLLQDYVKTAVSESNEGLRRTMIEQTGRLLEYLKQAMPKGVVLDSGALVGELTPAIDMQLSVLSSHARRGNTR